MSLLFQKDVPLIVSILIAAWTWIISQNIQQTNDLQIIEYQYNYKDNPSQIFFRNISQSKSVKNLQILVSCDSGNSCFIMHDQYAGTTKLVPPFGVVPTTLGLGEPAGKQAKRAYFTFSLPVDAAIVLALNMKPQEHLRFAIIDSSQFEKLKVLDKASATAFFYRNYLLIIMSLLVIASLGVTVLIYVFGKESKPTTDTTPTTHNVNLTIRMGAQESEEKGG